MGRTLSASSALLLLAIGACEGCPGEDFTPLTPKIELVSPDDRSTSPCEVDNVFQCAHDFGDVRTDRGALFTFRVLNDGDAELAVSELTLEGDPAFTLVEPPEVPLVIDELKDPEAQPVDLTVRFLPVVENTVSATLTITSDAGNLEGAGHQPVILELTGTGVDIGGPKLRVQPSECAFGEIGVNATGYCDLSLENIGTRDLQIDDVTFGADTLLADSEGEPGFGLITWVPSPTFVAAGTATGIRLHATPESPAPMTGTLHIVSNDPESPTTEVPLSVLGADAPTAVADLLSVNGVPVEGAAPAIRPLDDVVVTGENSVPASADGAIIGWHWEIVAEETTPNSHVSLTTPDAMTTGFHFDSAAGTVTGIDVAGTFVVRLTVTDDDMRTSTNDARVTFVAIPSEALHIQLTWDSPTSDIDVHLTKDGGAWCHQSDSCYYGNCKPEAFLPPEWDGVAGRTAGDPSLDIDDLSGYGPENINIDLPVDAGYRIGVHAYSPLLEEPVFATLKIFVNGALAFEDGRQLSAGRDFWEVAQVDWAAGAAILFPLGDVTPGWSCP